MALNCSAVMNRTQATTAKSSCCVDDCKTFQRLRAASAHAHERRCTRARMQANTITTLQSIKLPATIALVCNSNSESTQEFALLRSSTRVAWLGGESMSFQWAGD